MVAAVPVGLLATALLVVNNLRDIDTDRRAGKKTLAVRIGAAVTRWFYATCVIGAFALVVVDRLLAARGFGRTARGRSRPATGSSRARRCRGS